MKLTFKNSQGVEREIGQPNNQDGVVEIINQFLEERNYKSYYYRINQEDGKLVYDVGSHTEFFVLYLEEEK